MKKNKLSQKQQEQQANALSSIPAANLSHNEINFAPAPDEVARRAYFSYVNQGSRSGHEVQHWLEAEKQLLIECELTRTRGGRRA